MGRLTGILALTLVLLSGCGGDDESSEEGRGTTAQTTSESSTHETEVDDVTCREVRRESRRLEVADELAGEYIGTLVARNLLLPAFAAELSAACQDAAPSTKPVPGIVERADVARRRSAATGISFTAALLEASSDDESAEPATGSLSEQAEAKCREFSIVTRDLNDAADDPEFDVATRAVRFLGDLAEDLDGLASAKGGADAEAVSDYAAGLRELGALTSEIADVQSPSAENPSGGGDASSLQDELRTRAAALQRSLPADFASCKALVEIYR